MFSSFIRFEFQLTSLIDDNNLLAHTVSKLFYKLLCMFLKQIHNIFKYDVCIEKESNKFCVKISKRKYYNSDVITKFVFARKITMDVKSKF